VLTFLAAVTTVSASSAASAHGDPCSYLSDAAAKIALSVPLSDKVQHARISNELCVYRAPREPGTYAFVNVVTGKPSALRRFAELLRFAGNRSQPIAVGDAAYTIGPNALALRGDTLIVAGIRNAGPSRADLRAALIRLLREAAY
jgi:hypothetical protein